MNNLRDTHTHPSSLLEHDHWAGHHLYSSCYIWKSFLKAGMFSRFSRSLLVEAGRKELSLKCQTFYLLSKNTEYLLAFKLSS